MCAQHGCTQSVITFEVLDRFRRSWARWKEKRIVFTFVTVPYFSAWGHGPGQGRNIYLSGLSLHRDIVGSIYVGPGVRAVGKRGCTQSVITFEVLDRFRRSWARWKEKRIVRALGYVRSHENAPVIFQTQGKVLFFRKYSDGIISG